MPLKMFAQWICDSCSTESGLIQSHLGPTPIPEDWEGVMEDRTAGYSDKKTPCWTGKILCPKCQEGEK